MPDYQIKQFSSDQEISDWVAEMKLPENEEVLIPNGYPKACIGITDSEPHRLIYSKQLIVKCLMEHEMTEEDAWDYLGYNVVSSYVGDGTPIFIDTMIDWLP